MIEEVPLALDGERTDRVVALVLGCSRAHAAALVAGGHVRLDDQVVIAGKQRVAAGDELAIDDALPRGVAAPEADSAVVVPVVYADDDVIVVDKPVGLVVHPGSGNPTGTLVNGLLARYPELATVGDPARPGIVHRLDAGTSGLLVVARSDRAYDALVAALSARTVTREYLALVWGVPESTAGLIDAPLGRSQREPTKMAVTVGGREARTRYRVTAAFSEPVPVAELRCSLETGRTHQIRVHLAAIDHPVVGDLSYGGPRSGLTVVVNRPMLHAARLAFVHPGTGEQMSFDSPIAADMAAVRASLS